MFFISLAGIETVLLLSWLKTHRVEEYRRIRESKDSRFLAIPQALRMIRFLFTYSGGITWRRRRIALWYILVAASFLASMGALLSLSVWIWQSS